MFTIFYTESFLKGNKRKKNTDHTLHITLTIVQRGQSPVTSYNGTLKGR